MLLLLTLGGIMFCGGLGYALAGVFQNDADEMLIGGIVAGVGLIIITGAS